MVVLILFLTDKLRAGLILYSSDICLAEQVSFLPDVCRIGTISEKEGDSCWGEIAGLVGNYQIPESPILEIQSDWESETLRI